MEKNEETIPLPVTLGQLLLQYLAGRPAGEVYDLISQLLVIVPWPPK